MNIVFITLIKIERIEQKDIYSDLMRYFVKQGHHVTIFSPLERREGKETTVIEGEGYKIVRFKTFNIQKVGYAEKLLATFSIEYQLLSAVKQYLSGKVDLVLYSTPPITITAPIKYIKARFNAKSYLMLKDIFPQNAIDLGLFTKTNPLYWFFSNKEKKLYEYSDVIGCMSDANIEWLKRNHKELSHKKIEICPNSVELSDKDATKIVDKSLAKQKLGIPIEQNLFVFGGNLGLPQGTDFLLDVFGKFNHRKDIMLMIIGSGTAYSSIENWIAKNQPSNIILKPFVPKEEYASIVEAADFGIISLNHKFTIPNYPSRILSLMESKTPVLSITDANTDITALIEQNNLGVCVTSNVVEDAVAAIETLLKLNQAQRNAMGERAYDYLQQNFLVEHTYNIIVKHF